VRSSRHFDANLSHRQLLIDSPSYGATTTNWESHLVEVATCAILVIRAPGLLLAWVLNCC
jgi:hypothetical protein